MTHMAVADDPRPNSWHFVSDCTSVLSYLYLTMPPNGCSTGCYELHAANTNIYFSIKSLMSVASVSIEHFKLNHKQKLPWRIWSTSSLTYHLDQTNLSIAVCSSLNHRKDQRGIIVQWSKRHSCYFWHASIRQNITSTWLLRSFFFLQIQQLICYTLKILKTSMTYLCS